MKQISSVVAIAVLISACSPPTSSDEALGVQKSVNAAEHGGTGPFGFDFGAPISEVTDAKALDKSNMYSVASPPKPHSDFESVVLIAFPDTGICTIRGIGRTLDGDGSGAQIRTKVDELAGALSTKYGNPKKIDACSGGDIQCDGQFWMMTLDGGERAYGYNWTTPNEAMKQAKIRAIYVGSAAENIQASYPVIEYISDNGNACEMAEKSSSASSL